MLLGVLQDLISQPLDHSWLVYSRPYSHHSDHIKPAKGAKVSLRGRGRCDCSAAVPSVGGVLALRVTLGSFG